MAIYNDGSGDVIDRNQAICALILVYIFVVYWFVCIPDESELPFFVGQTILFVVFRLLLFFGGGTDITHTKSVSKRKSELKQIDGCLPFFLIIKSKHYNFEIDFDN